MKVKKLLLSVLIPTLCLGALAACKKDDASDDPAHDHKYGEWVVTLPSPSAKGEAQKSCTVGKNCDKIAVELPMFAENSQEYSVVEDSNYENVLHVTYANEAYGDIKFDVYRIYKGINFISAGQKAGTKALAVLCNSVGGGSFVADVEYNVAAYDEDKELLENVVYLAAGLAREEQGNPANFVYANDKCSFTVEVTGSADLDGFGIVVEEVPPADLGEDYAEIELNKNVNVTGCVQDEETQNWSAKGYKVNVSDAQAGYYKLISAPAVEGDLIGVAIGEKFEKNYDGEWVVQEMWDVDQDEDYNPIYKLDAVRYYVEVRGNGSFKLAPMPDSYEPPEEPDGPDYPEPSSDFPVSWYGTYSGSAEGVGEIVAEISADGFALSVGGEALEAGEDYTYNFAYYSESYWTFELTMDDVIYTVAKVDAGFKISYWESADEHVLATLVKEGAEEEGD